MPITKADVKRLLDQNEKGFSQSQKDVIEDLSGRTMKSWLEEINEEPPEPAVPIDEKTKQDFSVEEKAALFTGWREQGLNPREEWDKIPAK